MTALEPVGPKGPAILAVDPWIPGNPSRGKMHQLLTAEERTQLAVIASVVRFKKGEEIYRSGAKADAIFNIISGVVKSCTGGASDADSAIVAFLFANDLFGLSEEGFYTNSAKAVTPVTAYRVPVTALRARLSKNAGLEYHVICKLCHELRQAQRHAFLLSQRRAETKIAMFLQMLEHLQAAKGEPTGAIHLPMDRSDMADYLGMSLPAVSRTFGRLTARGIIRNGDRRHVTIVDREGFESIVAGDTPRRSGRRRRS